MDLFDIWFHIWVIFVLIFLGLLLFFILANLLVICRLAYRAILLASFQGYWGDFFLNCEFGGIRGILALVISLVLAFATFVVLVPIVIGLHIISSSRWKRMQQMIQQPIFYEGIGIFRRESSGPESFHRALTLAANHVTANGIPLKTAKLGLRLLITRYVPEGEDAEKPKNG